jgi:hypothetical protein
LEAELKALLLRVGEEWNQAWKCAEETTSLIEMIRYSTQNIPRILELPRIVMVFKLHFDDKPSDKENR